LAFARLTDIRCDLLAAPGRRGQRSDDGRLACTLMLIAAGSTPPWSA